MTVEIIDCEQGSPEWFQARLGLPTASEFSSVMAKGQGKTRRAYMLRLIGERITGEPAETYQNAHMERGKIMEEEARNAYAFMQDVDPMRVGFIRNGNVGCSPDSMIGDSGLVEIKTKLPHLQIEVLLADRLPPEHVAQVQGQLWVAEREWCDFVSYWPRLPLFVKRVHRDEAVIAEIKREVEEFSTELRKLEDRIRAMGGSLSEPNTILGAA